MNTSRKLLIRKGIGAIVESVYVARTDSFKSHVWASVTSFNLIVLARHLLAREFA